MRKEKLNVEEMQQRFAIAEAFANEGGIAIEAHELYVKRAEELYLQMGDRRLSLYVLRDYERRLSLMHSALKAAQKNAKGAGK